MPQLPTFSAQQLVDVDRVELLKGPQSTLYGKSAQGGVLNIISRRPDNDPRFRASAGAFSRDGYQFRASASGPLVKDLLYGTVAGVVGDAPGRLSNPMTGADGVGGTSTSAVSARLRLAPLGGRWELGPGLYTARRMGLVPALRGVEREIGENVYRDRRGRELMRIRYRELLKEIEWITLKRTDLVRVLHEAVAGRSMPTRK